jgi:hypothetical protein
MKWILWLVLCTPTAFAAEKSKTVCAARDLARKDCRLSMDSVSLRLLPDSVAWYDGTWHTVDEMPLKGKQSDWEKITFTKLAEEPILQLWIWDQGDEITGVQSLHWMVIDVEKRKFALLSEGVVRKRRPKAKVADAPDDAKTQYLYDAALPHGLKALKSRELEWTLGSEKKILKGAHHGI